MSLPAPVFIQYYPITSGQLTCPVKSLFFLMIWPVEVVVGVLGVVAAVIGCVGAALFPEGRDTDVVCCAGRDVVVEE